MASASPKTDDAAGTPRVKRAAKATKSEVKPEQVVARLYDKHMVDMARLAE